MCIRDSTYTDPNGMVKYNSGDPSGTNLTHSSAVFRIHPNRLICTKVSEGYGGAPTDPDANPKENGKEIAKVTKTSQNLTLADKKNGAMHFVIECTDGKNVTCTISDSSGKKLADAAYQFVDGYFNDSTPRYFGITQFNAIVFELENFKIEDSDIPESIGAAGALSLIHI